MSQVSFPMTEEWRSHARKRLEAHFVTKDRLTGMFAKQQVTKIGRRASVTVLGTKGMQQLEEILDKLCHLLQQLPPERRRTMLVKQLVQTERLVLEQWLLARKACGQDFSDRLTGDASMAVQCAAPRPAAKEKLRCPKRYRQADSKPGNCCRGNDTKQGERRIRYSHRVEGDDLEKCRGIQSCSEPGGRVSYFVKLMVTDNLLIRTNIVRDLHLVRSALAALLGVRAAVAGVDAVELESRLQEELETSFWAAPWNPGRLLRLQFCVIVAARCWIGQQLATPYFADLKAALAVRCRLLWARGATSQGNRSDLMRDIDADAAWIKVSSTYAAVCAEAGRSYSAACARLSSLRKRESRRRLRQARHSKGSVTEKVVHAQLRLEARERRRRQQVERKAKLSAHRAQRAAERTKRTALSLEKRIARLLVSYRKCLQKLL